MKFYLRRIVSETLLTFEELATLLIQIEATLNACPLETLTDDPQDVSGLTLGHFLIGYVLMTVPESSLGNISTRSLAVYSTADAIILEAMFHTLFSTSTGNLQMASSIEHA